MPVLKGWFFTTMKIEELVCPTSGCYFRRITDSYWLITDKDEVLFFGSSRSPFNSPQCNSNDGIASRLKAGPAKQGIIVVGTKFIPIAFQPIRIEDYQ